MDYKKKYLKYKKKYINLKLQTGGDDLLKLQVSCNKLSFQPNHKICIQRPDCYLEKKVIQGQEVSKNRIIKSEPKIITQCVQKNQIPLDIQQVQNLFIQEDNICWLHTKLSALFFSDIFRDNVWGKCFVLTKYKDRIIPTATKFNNINDESHFWYLITDLIRQILIQMFKNISSDTVDLEKPNLYTERRQIIHDSIKSCNLTFQKLLCKLARDVNLEFCGENDVGGYMDPSNNDTFIHKFLNFMDLNEKYIFTTIHQYDVDYDVEDWEFEIMQLKLEDNKIFFVVYDFTETDSHVVLFFKLNNQWCYFDNNNDGSIINLEVKDENVEITPHPLRHRYKFELVSLYDLLRPIKTLDTGYSENFNIKDIQDIYIWEKKSNTKESPLDIVEIKDSSCVIEEELFENTFYKYINGILETNDKEVIFEAIKKIIENPTLVDLYKKDLSIPGDKLC